MPFSASKIVGKSGLLESGLLESGLLESGLP
jgi:hypothetical protein